MEASGTPTAAADRQPARRQRRHRPLGGEPKATGGWRALAVILFLALAFACAVMVIAMSDIGSTPTCEDVLSGKAALPSDNECFDGSTAQKTASLVLGWPSGVLAGIAALVAIFFAATGRRGRLLLTLTGSRDRARRAQHPGRQPVALGGPIGSRPRPGRDTLGRPWPALARARRSRPRT